MSLSAHLRTRRSPVREWIEERFPATRHVARDANIALCAAGQCPLPRPEGADASLVGIGVDYLLRSCLRARALDHTVASKGVARLDPIRRIGGRAGDAERQALARIKALAPSRRRLTDPEWIELCRLCLLLARFEQYFRTGGLNWALIELLMNPLFEWEGDLDQLLAEVVPETSVQDLADLGRAAVADHRRLRRARPLYPNPKFALSIELGGADADLIAAGTLIDWKATATRSVVGREQLWQLIGYALADTENKYAIQNVGLVALRWRTQIIWDLEDLMAQLAEKDPGKLTDLRAGFADVVQEHWRGVVARREARLAEREAQAL